MKTLESEDSWALEKLSLKSNDPAEVLRYIQKEDFALDDDAYEAVCKLSNLEIEEDYARYSVTKKLRERVENFAERYFQLPPERRAAEFQDISYEAVGYEEVKPRLSELEKGLTLDASRLPSGFIVDFILETYVLPLNKRSQKYDELNKIKVAQKLKLRKEYNSLKTRHPELTSLLPYFFEKIKERKPPIVQDHYQPQQKVPKKKDENVGVWAAVVLGIFLFKGLIFLGSNSTGSSYNPPQQNYNQNYNPGNRNNSYNPQNNPFPNTQPGYPNNRRPGFPNTQPGYPNNRRPGFPNTQPGYPGTRPGGYNPSPGVPSTPGSGIPGFP